MLIRVFRGVIREGAHETLVRELHDDVLPRIEAHPDVAYVSLGLPWETSPNEYLLETHWRSKEALIKLVGEDWMKPPRVEEFEQHLLVSVSAHHYLSDRSGYQRAGLPRMTPPVVRFGGIEADGLRHEVRWDGSVMRLPPREMSAMLALAADAGAPVASADLARHIWPGSALVTAYDVRRVIYQLRTRLRSERIPVTIRNVHGWGYCLDLSSLAKGETEARIPGTHLGFLDDRRRGGTDG